MKRQTGLVMALVAALVLATGNLACAAEGAHEDGAAKPATVQSGKGQKSITAQELYSASKQYHGDPLVFKEMYGGTLLITGSMRERLLDPNNPGGAVIVFGDPQNKMRMLVVCHVEPEDVSAFVNT